MDKLKKLNLNSDFMSGIKDGIPIFLGYISVAFAFGMTVTSDDLPIWTALLISITNFTSAGQFAGLDLILSNGLYIEIAVTLFIINVRYLLMSLSLSQKLDNKTNLLQRLILSFGVTDEIFASSMQKKAPLTFKYLIGVILIPYMGWILGTFVGANIAEIMPQQVQDAMGIIVYAMFLAIIIPPCKKVRPVLITVATSAILSCILDIIPLTASISKGWNIIICTIAGALIPALRYPVKSEETAENVE